MRPYVVLSCFSFAVDSLCCLLYGSLPDADVWYKPYFAKETVRILGNGCLQLHFICLTIASIDSCHLFIHTGFFLGISLLCLSVLGFYRYFLPVPKYDAFSPRTQALLGMAVYAKSVLVFSFVLISVSLSSLCRIENQEIT